jgi:competence protein ComEA
MWETILFFVLVSANLPAPAQDKSAKLEGVINLNTASPEELRLLSGIGPSRIRDILAYRKEHPFRVVEELARIKGIGPKTVRRMRIHLAVSGPTTIQKVIRPIENVGLQVTKPPKGRITETVVSTKVASKVVTNQPTKVHVRTNHFVVEKESRSLGLGNHCLPPP